MLLRELIQRAVSIASHGQSDPSLLASAEQAAEALLPAVFREVGDRAARTERLRTTLRRTKALAVVSGEVALPSDVLTAYINGALLLDPTDITKLYSWAPYHQFITGTLDTRLGHFAIEGESSLHVVEPNTSYNSTTGPTIDLLLTIPCSPAIPAIDAAIAVIDEIVDMLLTTLVEALKLKVYARR